MTVGLVIVSHSAQLAAGVVELAGQMTQGKVRLAAAGGAAGGVLGTSVERIAAAIAAADQGDGVLILLDLGSALMSAEIALEALVPEQRARVQISAAPLVEGAVVAAVEAAVGSPLAAVALAAQSALTTPKAPLAALDAAGRAELPGGAPQARGAVLLTNRVGLHARPASLLVQMAARFTARITLRVEDRVADAKRILSILQLGARCGETLTIEATGPDAAAAVAALIALARRKFDEDA